jgi:integrase
MKPKTGYYRLMDQILQEDESAYRLFIESPPSPASRIVYWNDLKLYAQYRKVEAFEDLLKWDPRLLQSQIIDYIIYLKGQRLSGNSINTRINSIKKFYESNDIDLRWRKIKGYMGSKRRVKKDRPYTYEEIRKILDKANERERVVIYLLISSGMRIGALNTLKIKHL